MLSISPTLGPPLNALNNQLTILYTDGHNQLLQDCLYCVLSSTNLNNPKCPLYVLYQFLLQRSAINTGAVFVSELIKLYNTLCNNLAYIVTKSDAETNNLFQIIDKYASQFKNVEETIQAVRNMEGIDNIMIKNS